MNGARVGITAARRADEQAAIVRALGGKPVHGPSVNVDVPAPDEQLAGTLRELLESPIDTAVFVTGVGARHLLEAARREGLLDDVLAAVRSARVIARGTKPRRVLREFDVPVEWIASPAESRVIRDALVAERWTGRRVLVQCAGAAPDVMVAPLQAVGARVIEAHPYEIDIPPDAGDAVRLAEAAAAGQLDAVTFTSAHAAHGFAALVERAGIDVADVTAAGALIVAVGPVTRDALLEHGFPVHVEPETPRMGAMYQALATALTTQLDRTGRAV